MKFVLFFLIFSNFVKAETFKISGESIFFENKNGLIVKGCEKECLALKTVAEFKNINLKKARIHEKFEGSIGSDVCRLVYKSHSIIGIAENLDQRAFCVFIDNSLIEINSLSQYLKDKNIVKE